jgi:ATP-dependent 26S proteasome regulatory subunit
VKKVAFALTVIALASCASALGWPGEVAQVAKGQKPDTKARKELMHRKLEHSQRILEALALNDLDKAGKHAGELLRIRKEAPWQAIRSREYQIWSDEFQQSAEGIVKAAKDKNLEAAKLQYLSMTLSCFHCHTYVRDQGQLGADRFMQE